MNFYRFIFPLEVDDPNDYTVELIDSPPRIPLIDCPECENRWPDEKIQIFEELTEDPMIEVPHFGAVPLDVMDRIYDKVRKIYNLSEDFKLGPGTVLGKYRFKLLTNNYTDFNWYGGYMCFTEKALNAFIKHGLTGWSAGEVIMENHLDEEAPPKMYQLIVTGKGGPAKIEKQPPIKFECDVCGKIKFNLFDSDYFLVDESKWDGSDFFRLDRPYNGPEIVSERVKQCFEQEKLTNYGLYLLDHYRLEHSGNNIYFEHKNKS